MEVTLTKISIHAPRTGSDGLLSSSLLHRQRFQSTLPARGATPSIAYTGMDQKTFQSTLPARGATRGLIACAFMPTAFQSTLPARGATAIAKSNSGTVVISIHAPRTGSDDKRPPASRAASNFNPRSPHGERPEPPAAARAASNFNPRSPHGERPRKVTILSIRIIGFAQKVYHKTVLLRISLAENAVILPEKPRNPVRTSLQKAGGLRFARAIRAARPYSISSPSGA